MRSGTTWNYFLTDHLGSVVAVTDSSGAVLAQTRYTEFGEVRSDVGSISQTDFGFTFQRNVPDTGLMDYKARMYDPLLGRFIQPDTLVPGAANPQMLNRYSYTGNNPINFTDPTGHKGCNEYDENGNCVKEINLGLNPKSKSTGNEIISVSTGVIIITIPSTTPTPNSIPGIQPIPTPDGTPTYSPPPSYTTEDFAEDINFTAKGLIDAFLSYSLFQYGEPGAFDIQPQTALYPVDEQVPYLKGCLHAISTLVDLSALKGDTMANMTESINLDDGLNISDWISAYNADRYWFNK